jgi:hypothetical protein
LVGIGFLAAGFFGSYFLVSGLVCLVSFILGNSLAWLLVFCNGSFFKLSVEVIDYLDDV